MYPANLYQVSAWAAPRNDNVLEVLLAAAAARDRLRADPARQQLMQWRMQEHNAIQHSQLVQFLCQLQVVPVPTLTPGQLDAAAHLRAALHLLNRAFSFAPLPQDVVKLETWCVGVVMTLREAMVAVHTEGTFVTLHESESRRYSTARAHYQVALRYLHIDHTMVTRFLTGAERLRHPPIVRYLPAAPSPREMLHRDITVASSRIEGQYMRARGPFTKGTLVLVEKPLAAVLLPWLYHAHCYHCFERIFEQAACSGCRLVRFCSEECRISASAYHRLECPVMSDLLMPEVLRYSPNVNQAAAQAQLAWRMVTQFSLEENRSLYQDGIIPSWSVVRQAWCRHLRQPVMRHERWRSDRQLARHDPTTNYHQFEEPLSRARRVHALSTDALRRPPMHYQRFLTVAVALKELLLRTDFFYSSPSLDKDELMILDLLMRSLMQVSNNHHYVTQSDSIRRTHVGIAIYATGSLFNSDSLHNVTRDFHGKTLLYRTSSSVAAGQPVSDNIISFELQFSAGAMVTAEPQPAPPRIPEPLRRCGRCLPKRSWLRLEELSTPCIRRCTTAGCNASIASEHCASHRLCFDCVRRLRGLELRPAPIVSEYLDGMEELIAGDVESAHVTFRTVLEQLRTEEYPPRSLCQMARSSLELSNLYY